MKRRVPRARPLALAALTLISGLLLGLHGLASASLPVAALVSLVAGALAILRNRRDLLAIATLAALVTGGALMGYSEQRRARSDCRSVWEAGDRISVTGVALSYMPRGERGAVRLRPRKRATGRACRWIGALRIWTDGPAVPGTTYRLEGSWRPAPFLRSSLRAPERWGWIAADSLNLVRSGRLVDHPVLTARGATAQRIWRTYPRRWAPLAEALILGQRETVNPEISRRLARSGLAHLLAISGLHIGLLAAALVFLARIARAPPRSANIITVCCVFAYVTLIGAPPSAVRAAVIILLWTLSRQAGRASSPYDALGLTAVLLLVARPWSVLEPGFQLSFAGAVGVGFAYSETRRSAWVRAQPTAVRALVVSATASAGAVLLTAPITARYFGQVALAGIVGNLVAVPLLGLAMPAFFVSALLSPWPVLAGWPMSAAVVLLHAIDGVADLLSSADWLLVELALPNPLFALAYLLLLVLGAHTLHGAWYRRRFVFAVGCASAALMLWSPLQNRLAPTELSIHILDVGQGDAIAIKTPRRHWVLIDAGPRISGFDAGERRVLPFLKAHGVRRLEAWLMTHPDLDHVGGGPAVLEAVQVDRVIGSGRVTGQSGQIAVLETLAHQSGQWIRAAAGAQMRLDGMVLRFFHPAEQVSGRQHARPNEYSLVFLLQFGAFRMLFTGDAPGGVEDRLSLAHASRLRAQVLKVAHHGSASSTSREFLATVAPQLAVISVGRGNRYGHPSPYVLHRLASQGVELRRSDRDGRVVIEANWDGSWRLRSAARGL